MTTIVTVDIDQFMITKLSIGVFVHISYGYTFIDTYPSSIYIPKELYNIISLMHLYISKSEDKITCKIRNLRNLRKLR